jgi:hypothetical protein
MLRDACSENDASTSRSRFGPCRRGDYHSRNAGRLVAIPEVAGCTTAATASRLTASALASPTPRLMLGPLYQSSVRVMAPSPAKWE